MIWLCFVILALGVSISVPALVIFLSDARADEFSSVIHRERRIAHFSPTLSVERRDENRSSLPHGRGRQGGFRLHKTGQGHPVRRDPCKFPRGHNAQGVQARPSTRGCLTAGYFTQQVVGEFYECHSRSAEIFPSHKSLYNWTKGC